MTEKGPIADTAAIMAEFAESTGLSGRRPQRRYLWTDAFAVCNFIGLFRLTGEERWRGLALRLVDQVHHTLGWHRQEGARMGWISGLDAEEGEEHPTMGGLRIGKELDERRRGEAYSERLEWERDGQYFHYLTKWMHALNVVRLATGDGAYGRWGVELAATACRSFIHELPAAAGKGLYWKMSIDLSYPLVTAMGQHDPLDGLVTCRELQRAMAGYTGKCPLPDLGGAIGDLEAICRGEEWTTDDPLGIGGLLFDLWRIIRLATDGVSPRGELLGRVLDAALKGLKTFTADNPLKYRARQRLPFRELGLAIGLKAVASARETVVNNPLIFSGEEDVARMVESLSGYLPLASVIERFWLDERNRDCEGWRDHRDINMVMLAASLVPDGFLAI